MDFEKAWYDLRELAGKQGQVHTVGGMNVRNVVDDVTDSRITVTSQRTGKPRHLDRDDFRFAWDKLSEQGKLTMSDLEPALRYRKAVVFAFLANLDCVRLTPGSRPAQITLRV